MLMLAAEGPAWLLGSRPARGLVSMDAHRDRPATAGREQGRTKCAGHRTASIGCIGADAVLSCLGEPADRKRHIPLAGAGLCLVP